MHLWNDYEGTTLAGQWKLGKLLRTEGRSALFSTTQPDGRAAVLRLTEALNDQAVLRARFRSIQAAGDTYLVAVEGFGDAELDGSPLSYAVLEATQESLADILAQRRLAPDEVHEVATSVAGGLLALHGQGLVHGLVEPESVLAAGDRIKLRSDCARPRPAPEDAELEGAVTEQSDAFGLADIIYRSLTLGRLQDASDALALPEPFATVVRNTAKRAWGVPEAQAELLRYARAHAQPAAAAAPQRAAETSAPEQRGVAASSATASSSAAISSAATPRAAQPSAVSPATAGPAASAVAVAASALTARVVAAKNPGAGASQREAAPMGRTVGTGASVEASDSGWQQPERVSGATRRNIAIAAIAAVLLVLLFLLFHRGSSGTKTSSAVAPAGPVATQPDASTPAPIAPAPREAPAVAPAAESTSLPAGTTVWRVIAYTYNRRDAAEGKAALLNRRFPDFSAQVWSRSGERPFLVTLGGGMAKDQAFALRAKARHAGVAPDVYAQNYRQ